MSVKLAELCLREPLLRATDGSEVAQRGSGGEHALPLSPGQLQVGRLLLTQPNPLLEMALAGGQAAGQAHRSGFVGELRRVAAAQQAEHVVQLGLDLLQTIATHA